MRWIEGKLHRVATTWGVPEAMAARPTRQQRKELKETCLTESTLGIWLEIEGAKLDSRYVRVQHHIRTTQTTKIRWESGFGLANVNNWIPIEDITSRMVYTILINKRSKLQGYVLNIAHKHIQKIQKYLTSKERNYWWRLNHNIISTKRTEHTNKQEKLAI